MNTHDVMMYGQRTFLKTLDGFPEAEWETPGVTGVWSAKDVVSHLASHEQVLLDVLNGFLEHGDTPALSAYMKPDFNDSQVAMRKQKKPREVLAELKDAHAQSLALIQKIPPEIQRETGTLPWYGDEYCLEDYIAYGVYGHKREHSAQIAVFLDNLNREER